MPGLNAIRIASLLFTSLLVASAMAQSVDMQLKTARPTTLAALAADDGQDDEFVQRGFIAPPAEREIRRADGHMVWHIGSLERIKADAPPSVNPSLWRQAKLLGSHGLFKIAEGVWQMRGRDAATMRHR